jgi:hypothetical protein
MEPLDVNAKLHFTRENGENVIRWDKGILESALLPSGTWLAVDNVTSPYLISANGKQRFFRLRAAVD